MTNFTNKKNTANLVLTIFIVSNPFIDLLVSLSRRFTSSSLSIASILRGLTFGLAFLLCIYISFNKKGQKTQLNRLTRILVLTSVVGIVSFLITRPFEFQFKAYLVEINELVRFLYFPFVFLALVNLDVVFGFDRKQLIQSLKYTCTIYSLFVVVPYVTNTGFDSYVINQLEGSVGWLFGANEIGMIIGVLINVYLFDVISKNFSKRILVELAINFIAVILLGTKAPMVLIVFFISVVFFQFLTHMSRKFRLLFLTSVSLVFMLIVFFSPVGQNIMFLIKDSTPGKLIRILLSGRLTFLDNALLNYETSMVSNKVFGMGFMLTNNAGHLAHDKFIEMDFFEVFLRYGIINFAVIFSPLAIIFMQKSKKRAQVPIRKVLTGLVVIIFILSFLVGHVVSSPSVSIYVSLLLMYLYCDDSKSRLSEGVPILNSCVNE